MKKSTAKKIIKAWRAGYELGFEMAVPEYSRFDRDEQCLSDDTLNDLIEEDLLAELIQELDEEDE